MLDLGATDMILPGNLRIASAPKNRHYWGRALTKSPADDVSLPRQQAGGPLS
jgi:hypothetical protein